MSKKKNTLKDLDEFLKQQAAALVQPEKLVASESETNKETQPIEHTPKKTETTIQEALTVIKNSFKNDPAFRVKLYDLLLEIYELQPSQAAEDKMMINTLLYLKSGDNWKEVIRQYWRSRE